MAVTIKRLAPGDEAILQLLAAEEADFDLAGRGAPLRPLNHDVARSYLANPAVLHWVAIEEGEITGDLQCILVPLSAGEGEGEELLLYDIGVRSTARRRGTGRALLAYMESWMRANGISHVWVLADNTAAVAFYHACGFETANPQPVYMVRRLAAREGGDHAAQTP